MNLNNIYIKFIYLAVFLYIFLMYVLLVYYPTLLTITDYSLLLSTLTTVITSWYVVSCYGPNNIHATSFRYIFVGSVAIFLADLAQTIFILYFPQFVYPYPTDFLYAIGYIFFLFGMFREIANYGFFRSVKKIYLLMGSFLIFIIYLFYIFNIYNVEDSFLRNIANIIFRTGDFLNLLTVLVVVRITYEFRKSQMFRPWLMVLIGILLTIIGGVLYNIFYDNYKLKEHFLYNFIDLFWAGGYILVSYGFYLVGSIIKNYYNTARFKLKFSNLIANKYAKNK